MPAPCALIKLPLSSFHFSNGAKSCFAFCAFVIKHKTQKQKTLANILFITIFIFYVAGIRTIFSIVASHPADVKSAFRLYVGTCTGDFLLNFWFTICDFLVARGFQLTDE